MSPSPLRRAKGKAKICCVIDDASQEQDAGEWRIVQSLRLHYGQPILKRVGAIAHVNLQNRYDALTEEDRPIYDTNEQVSEAWKGPPVCVVCSGENSVCESELGTEIATGKAREEATRAAEEILHDVQEGLWCKSSDVEAMLLQWRASPKGDDRQRLKADPDSVIKSDTLGCTRDTVLKTWHVHPLTEK